MRMNKAIIPFKENSKAKIPQTILYQDKYFAVAIGDDRDCDGECIEIGIRWHRNRIEEGKDNPIGYPHSHGHPCWFIMPDNLAIDFLKTLIGKVGAEDEEICKAIKILQDISKERK